MEENLPKLWESILKRLQSIYLTLHGFLRILFISYSGNYCFFLFCSFYAQDHQRQQFFLFIISLTSTATGKTKKDSFQDEFTLYFTVWSFRSFEWCCLFIFCVCVSASENCFFSSISFYEKENTNTHTSTHTMKLQAQWEHFPKIKVFLSFLLFLPVCIFSRPQIENGKNFCVLPILRLKREIASGESGFALGL